MAHDTSGTEPTHLDNHHLDTVTAILSHPASGNVRWADVVSLVGAIGNVDEQHNGKFRLTIGAETEVFERPKEADIDVQQIVDLRRMLRNAGYTDKAPGKEV